MGHVTIDWLIRNGCRKRRSALRCQVTLWPLLAHDSSYKVPFATRSAIKGVAMFVLIIALSSLLAAADVSAGTGSALPGAAQAAAAVPDQSGSSSSTTQQS